MAKEYIISDQAILLRLAKNAKNAVELSLTSDNNEIINSGAGINDSFDVKKAFKGTRFDIAVVHMLDRQTLLDSWKNNDMNTFVQEQVVKAFGPMYDVMKKYIVKFAGHLASEKLGNDLKTSSNVKCYLLSVVKTKTCKTIDNLLGIDDYRVKAKYKNGITVIKNGNIGSVDSIIDAIADKLTTTNMSMSAGVAPNSSQLALEQIPTALMIQTQYSVGKEEK